MTTRIVTDANGRKHITNEPLLHPPQRKPLTDEEALELWSKHEKHWRFENNALAFARAIEAAHGIKGEA